MYWVLTYIKETIWYTAESTESTESTRLIQEQNRQEFKSSFAHLRFANQTYTTHMKDSLGYSWKSLKASFYFFVHSLYPDAFHQAGSDTIISLGDEILQKYTENINRITDTYS